MERYKTLAESDFLVIDEGFSTTKPPAEAGYEIKKVKKRINGKVVVGYMKKLKKGRIVGSRCKECNRTLLPARYFCEWCWRVVDEWVELKDTGVVNTFSICYTDWVARRIKKPELPAMIEVDGSGGVAIMGKLGEVDPKDIKIGMKVKAVWKPEEEREGAITDIKYWKPLKES